MITNENEWRTLTRSHIAWAILTLIFVFLLAGTLSLLFEDYIRATTQAIVDKLGFEGIALALFISDSIISPIPPDAILFVVAKSQLSHSWFFYVGILSLCSVAGGNIGWLAGYFLAEKKWPPHFILQFAQQKRELINKFGYWVVALGALTPLPFSITCWGAGIVKLKWSFFFLVTLLRIPRIFVAYFFLHNSHTIPSFF